MKCAACGREIKSAPMYALKEGRLVPVHRNCEPCISDRSTDEQYAWMANYTERQAVINMKGGE